MRVTETRIITGKTYVERGKNSVEIETYVPQVSIGGVWINACKKGTVIYKETQGGTKKVDQIELARWFLNNFVKKVNEINDFMITYNI